MTDNKKPLISVIIPCYNVEDCIDRCVKSLVDQTIGIENLELIFVNDASPDHTYDKLMEWEKKYPDSIMVISYEENLRQGGARNIGLKYASADWVGFVDSDDWVEPDMYAIMYEHAKTDKYDDIRCKMIRDYEGCDRTEYLREDQEYFFSKKSGFYVRNIPKTGNNGEFGAIPTGLFRKSIIIDNEIWFPEHTAYEDNYWGQIIGLYVSGLYIVDKVLYHYWVNMNSTIMMRNSERIADRLDIEVMILEKYKQLGAFDTFYNELEFGFIKRFFCNTWYMIFTRCDFIPTILMDMKKTVLTYFPNYLTEINMDRLISVDKECLKLLDYESEPSEEEWRRIKIIYLSYFA